jgi:hypothetical protein
MTVWCQNRALSGQLKGDMIIPNGVKSKVNRGATLAANNNADLYQVMFAAHQLRFRRLPHAFIGLDASPPYYANMTTLTPDDTLQQLADLESLASKLEGSLGVKDGFCRLDLTDSGFRVLFEASWLWAAPMTLSVDRSASDWERITTPRALADWEWSWKQLGSPTQKKRMFPETLIQSPQVAFFGLRQNARFSAGCMVNLSRDCVGLSNIFCETMSLSVYRMAALLAAEFGQGKPVVGYDGGAALTAMLKCGFEEVGPLRVWIRESA